MTPKELMDKYGRAELGVDGNCGYALLGGDLQEGESIFVGIPPADEKFDEDHQKIWACAKAIHDLRIKLNLPDLNYYCGPSHPYGN